MYTRQVADVSRSDGLISPPARHSSSRVDSQTTRPRVLLRWVCAIAVAAVTVAPISARPGPDDGNKPDGTGTRHGRRHRPPRPAAAQPQAHGFRAARRRPPADAGRGGIRTRARRRAQDYCVPARRVPHRGGRQRLGSRQRPSFRRQPAASRRQRGGRQTAGPADHHTTDRRSRRHPTRHLQLRGTQRRLRAEDRVRAQLHGTGARGGPLGAGADRHVGVAHRWQRADAGRQEPGRDRARQRRLRAEPQQPRGPREPAERGAGDQQGRCGGLRLHAVATGG